MKAVYPIIITPPENGGKYYLVYVPDFDINTEGTSLEDALFMARDAIGLLGIDYEDDGKPIPQAKTMKPDCKGNELLALVDVDFTAYRQMEDNRTVRKNCTLPLWLEREAEARNINFSAVLQDALKSMISSSQEQKRM